MSYPGRPPIMQGLPMYMGPPPLMTPVVPTQHMLPMHTTAPQIRALPRLNPNREAMKAAQGPAVTVFIGNITERAPDAMIRHILATCGQVISWKKVKAFGFCELAGPDAGLRAVRILHDLMVGDKRLVAKVDAKTKSVLDEYKAERRKREKGSSPLQDEPEEEELDEETLAIDQAALDRIKHILYEYAEEMSNYEIKKEEEELKKANRVLEEADVEFEKRDLITREIGKFREIMKKQEEAREKRKKEQKEKSGRDASDKLERSPTRSPSPPPRKREERKEEKQRRRRSKSRSHDSERSRDKERDREERDREREREREREIREREREREQRERERERERNRDRERERERDRDRDRDEKKSTKNVQRDKEMEEEAKEKKKIEKKAREKEAAYQERLRAWETRERRKAKEYEKDREKDRLKEEGREKEAKKLKEFLEDYDDERDDVRYYKGRELQRRLSDRVKEAEADSRDRLKEKEEIEELKSRIFSSELEDPTAEFERLKQEREELYKPKLLIDVNLETWKQKEREKERELERQKARERERYREYEREKDRQRQREEREKYIVQQAAEELAAVEAEPIESDSDMDDRHSPPGLPSEASNDNSTNAQWTQIRTEDDDSRHSFASNHEEPASQNNTGMKITLNTKPLSFSPQGSKDSKRKKLDLREVFNPDEDDTSTQVKKRKLVPLDYTEDKKSKKDKENMDKKVDESQKSQDEKRKHIKNLIENIPTEKDALFAYKLDWGAIDNNLMEKKLRPWINKKIIEYIGEPEPTLVDFICSKVLAGSTPQVILEDVQMVLDEEAEVFVVKMWRLLIYEVEAKKLGLVK